MATISSNGFNLTLDTLAPTGSIARTAEFCNAQQNLTIVASGGAAHYAVWYQPASETAVVPASPVWQEISAATEQQTAFANDGDYKYHMILRDDVGNVSEIFSTEHIGYDTQVPSVDSVSINNGAVYTRVRANSVKFTFSDPQKNSYASGIASATISGNIVDSPVAADLTVEEIAAGEATRDFTFTSDAQDGTQTLTITVVDKAGNNNTGTDSIILDTQAAVGHVAIYDTADTAAVTPYINYRNVTARLDAAGATDWIEYKCWTGALINEPSDWISVIEVASLPATGEAGKIYRTTSDNKTYIYNTNLTTPAFEESNSVRIALQLTAGDGEKTVYGKVRDKAQKEAGTNPDAVTATVKLDQTAPTASIVLSETHVSKVSSITIDRETYDFTDFTCTNTVTESYAGVKEYALKVNGTELASCADHSGTAAAPLTVPASFSLHQSDLGNEGKYTLTLWIKDNALNEVTSAGVDIYVDTTAPEGSVAPNCGNGGWYGSDDVDTASFYKFSTATATASATDGPTGDGAAGMWKMIAWCDTTAAPSVAPSTAVTSAYAANLTHAQIDWTNHADESDANYIHVQYVDKVGNANIITSAAFGIDTEKPNDGSIVIPEVTNTASITATISCTDHAALSGVAMMRIFGDVEDTGWIAYATSKSLILTGEDGEKTVKINFRDTAGNMAAGTPSSQTTSFSASDTTELDRTAPTATLALRQPDDSAAKASPSNDCQFKARISGTDDGTTGKAAYYTIYGEFNTGSQPEVGGGITRAAALDDWKELTYETGKDYLLTEMLYCEKNSTEGQEEKDVYLYVKDNAGNVYPHVEGHPTEPAASGLKQSFIYDTKAPTVTVSGVDYNRISKVHTVRNDNAEKYNDETKFTLTPDESIQAWKCVAYLTEAAAKAGNHEDAAIPTTAGSTNMSGSGISSSAAINSIVKGADYETALGGVTTAGDKDGLHYIVVYVQDLGGTWSKAATFTATFTA